MKTGHNCVVSVWRGDSVEKNAFESCAFCHPKTTEFVRATLNCPDKSVKRYRKKVQVIKTCSYMTLNLEWCKVVSRIVVYIGIQKIVNHLQIDGATTDTTDFKVDLSVIAVWVYYDY